jgi:hypothetical protein
MLNNQVLNTGREISSYGEEMVEARAAYVMLRARLPLRPRARSQLNTVEPQLVPVASWCESTCNRVLREHGLETETIHS